MALKTNVKVGEITHLSDARYCAGMGVDTLGFCLEEGHPKYVSPDTYAALSEWVTGVSFTAEFFSYSSQQIEEALAMYESVHSIQITNPQLIALLSKAELPIILRLEASDYPSLGELADVLREHHREVSLFLLENHRERSYLTVDDALQLAEQYPVLLGFGVTTDNVISIVDNSAISGISLKGSDEIKPGYKDYDDLAEILEKLEVDEAY